VFGLANVDGEIDDNTIGLLVELTAGSEAHMDY
jgi:hypothetical protein